MMQAKRRWLTVALWLVCQVIALSLLLPRAVYADDCLTDPLNAADCMRTPGFRPAISVIISAGGTAATILVNILSGTAPPPVAPPPVAPPTTVPPPVGPPSSAGPTPSAPPPPGPPVVQGPPQAPAGPGVGQRIQDAILSGTQSPGFDLIKNLAGPASTIIGSLSEFFTFPDSPQVIDALRRASQAWRANPTKATADAYVRAAGRARDVRMSRAAGRLDVAAKVVDVVDAVGTGLQKAQERGFAGVDKALTVGAELGKKGLTWILTKNPVVGLVDAAVGGATEMAWGKQGRIDIGSTIDKGANAWDQTTQEYFGYTQGVAAQDAALQTQDQFLHGLRRIKDQVNKGVLTREQGSARMRQLRDRMFGG